MPNASLLMSIQRPGARVTLHVRHGDVDVIEVEVTGHGSIAEPTLWGRSSWHFVVAGLALFRQGEQEWEVLEGRSTEVLNRLPYVIVNPVNQPLRLLSVVVDSGSGLEEDLDEAQSA